MKKGYFITFEGGEGSGKTTQIELLKDYFMKKNKKVKILREPGGTEISEKIREILLDKKYKGIINSKTELFLYMASRTQLYYEKILDLIENFDIILCDRFFDATLAYQGYARNLGIEKLYELNKWALDGFEPDLTIFFDLNIDLGLKREKSKDRFNLEGKSFHEKVADGYRIINRKFPDRIKKIDVNNKSIETVFDILKNIIKEKFYG